MATERDDLLFVPNGSSGEVKALSLHDPGRGGDDVLTLRGHLGMVYGISLRHSNQEIITAGKDGLILLWRPRDSGEEDEEEEEDGREDQLGRRRRRMRNNVDEWSEDEGENDTCEDDEGPTAFLPPILRNLIERAR